MLVIIHDFLSIGPDTHFFKRIPRFSLSLDFFKKTTRKYGKDLQRKYKFLPKARKHAITIEG